MKELVRFWYNDHLIRFANDPEEGHLVQLMREGKWNTVTPDELRSRMTLTADVALNLCTIVSVELNSHAGAEAIRRHFLAMMDTSGYREIGFRPATERPIERPKALN